MLKLSTDILKTLQHQIFPPACPVCKSAFSSVDHQEGCCAKCLSNIEVMPKDICRYCGIPMPTSLAPGPCGNCLSHTLPQLKTKSLFVYKGAVRDALLAWKLQGDSTGMTWLIKTSGAQLRSIFSADDLLIPVPMPLDRMRRSGLHHSANLCQLISKETGAKMDWRILRRSGVDKRQSSLKGSARQVNLCKAFQVTDDYSVKLSTHKAKGKIWVIDDILTTGATLRHACKAMRRTNEPVFAFSFARTLYH